MSCGLVSGCYSHFSSAAAERRELYRFSADLGKLALRIAEKYGSSSEKWFVNGPSLVALRRLIIKAVVRMSFLLEW